MSNVTPFLTLAVLDIDGHRVGLSFGPSVTVHWGDDKSLPDNIGGMTQTFTAGMVSCSLPSYTSSAIDASLADSGASLTLAIGECEALQQVQTRARLQASRATIFAWRDGQTLSQSKVLFEGVVRSPSIDLSRGEISMQIAPNAFEVNATQPLRKVGDPGRFPCIGSPRGRVPENNEDRALPVVYGYVRNVSVPACELYTEEIDNASQDFVGLVVASHRVVGAPGTPGFVRLAADEAGELDDLYEIQVRTDGLGDEFSYVQVNVMDWEDSIHVVEMIGKPSSRRGAVGMSGIGEVLVDLLRARGPSASRNTDFSIAVPEAEKMNKFEVGFALNEMDEQQTMFDIVRSRLEGQYPFVMAAPRGRYAIFSTEFPSASQTPAAHIIYGQNTFDRGAVTQSALSSVRNRFSFTFGYDGSADAEAESIEVNGDNNVLCAASLSMWGPTPIQALSYPDCPTAVGAGALVDDVVARLTKVRWNVQYSYVGDEFLDMPLRSVVLVTDEELGWYEMRFIVESISPDAQSGTTSVKLISSDAA